MTDVGAIGWTDAFEDSASVKNVQDECQLVKSGVKRRFDLCKICLGRARPVSGAGIG